MEALYVLRTTLDGRAVGLVGYVAVEDLVHYLEVLLVADLLSVAPEDGLIFFGGGQVFSSPFLSRASSLGRSVVPPKCCQPKKLGASLSGEALFTGVRGIRILGSSS